MLTKSDLNQIQKVIKNEQSSVREDIKIIKNDMFQIRRDVKTLVNYFDREYLELRKRIEVIEDQLNIRTAIP